MDRLQDVPGIEITSMEQLTQVIEAKQDEADFSYAAMLLCSHA